MTWFVDVDLSWNLCKRLRNKTEESEQWARPFLSQLIR